MAWGNYGDQRGGSGGRSSEGYVREGNVNILLFKEEPARVRFLTQDITVESVMSEEKVSREEAADILYTKVARERWVMPVPVWEHTIKEIPGKRYFSTAACRGRGSCQMCLENDEAKANGVQENKLLPYPVRKKFIVPAYVYDLKAVLFVRCSEDFFDDVATYMDKNGVDSDFEIFKTGKGLNTKYKSTFIEAGTPLKVDWDNILAPKDVDMRCTDEELAAKIGGSRAPAQASKPAVSRGPAVEAKVDFAAATAARAETNAGPVVTREERAKASDVAPAAKAEPEAAQPFKMPFGTHKGLTFDQMVKNGNGDYIKFLAENSTGEVQKQARSYLGVA